MNSIKSNQKVFYPHLHAFRGFAILNVIAAHTWVILLMIATQGQMNESQLKFVAISESIFHNATIYFALISGLLFSLVLKDYSWKAFYQGKLKNVVLPYTLFTIIYAFLTAKVFVPPGTETPAVSDVVSSIPSHWLNGSSSGHMWYIPVLFGLFIATPFLKFLLSSKQNIVWLCILIALPLVVSRTWPENTWQNYVFFLAPYSLGIWFGSRYEQVIDWINKYSHTLLVLAVITAPMLGYLYLNNVELVAGISLKESVGYFQKSVLGLLMIWLLSRYQDRSSKLLLLLGNHAFALYFLHMMFIILLSVIVIQLMNINLDHMSILFWGAVVFLMTIGCSLLFSIGIQKLFGRYSRMLIGN